MSRIWGSGANGLHSLHCYCSWARVLTKQNCFVKAPVLYVFSMHRQTTVQYICKAWLFIISFLNCDMMNIATPVFTDLTRSHTAHAQSSDEMHNASTLASNESNVSLSDEDEIISNCQCRKRIRYLCSEVL
jgi:hypothetical protein